jgi:hypothetical protein
MEKIRSYIPIVAVIAFAAGIYLFGDAVVTYLTYEPVEGVVSNVDNFITERHGRRGRRIREVGVEISYSAKGQPVQIQKFYSEDSTPELHSKIPMRYKPSNPSKAVVDQPGFDFGLAVGSFAIGVVGMFLTFRGWGSE